MNMNLFSHGDRYLMVDCGITFEQGLADSQGRPAIQMPDPSFIASQRDSLDGLIITHAHEDHFGAVPYLWQELQCPFTQHHLRRRYCAKSRLAASAAS